MRRNGGCAFTALGFGEIRHGIIGFDIPHVVLGGLVILADDDDVLEALVVQELVNNKVSRAVPAAQYDVVVDLVDFHRPELEVPQ